MSLAGNPIRRDGILTLTVETWSATPRSGPGAVYGGGSYAKLSISTADDGKTSLQNSRLVKILYYDIAASVSSQVFVQMSKMPGFIVQVPVLI